VRVFPAYAGPILKSGGIDKQFGAGTKSVVEEFQRRSGLVADGIVGSHTWSALEKDGFR
jgi:peptidoglycan hydrolase-like protein with peptidoglycan-binding domain